MLSLNDQIIAVDRHLDLIRLIVVDLELHFDALLSVLVGEHLRLEGAAVEGLGIEVAREDRRVTVGESIARWIAASAADAARELAHFDVARRGRRGEAVTAEAQARAEAILVEAARHRRAARTVVFDFVR